MSTHRPHGQRVVDVHAHFIPEVYRTGLLAAGRDHPDGSPIPPWNAAAHIEQLDHLGIDVAMLSLSSPGLDVDGRPPFWARMVNDAGADIVANHPDRFGWLASLPLPDVDESLSELTRVEDELHPDGFALLTQVGDVYLGDPRLDPVMAELDRRAAVVFIHPTSPAGCQQVDGGRPAPLVEYLFDTTRAVVNLMLNGVFQRYPRIRWIVPHNGAAVASVLDRVQLFNDYVLRTPEAETVDAVLGRLYYEIGSSAPFPRAATALLGIARPDRLLLGTDVPYAPPLAVAQNLERLLSGELLRGNELTALVGGNAVRLFPRLGQAE